jgi:hypothetical protein
LKYFSIALPNNLTIFANVSFKHWETKPFVSLNLESFMTLEVTTIKNCIFEVRGVRVMLDLHLAALYQVETRALKQAVRRNWERFPEDFMFELTPEEFDLLKPQFNEEEGGESKTGKHAKYLPFAFTEMGVGMLSSVLRSEKAIEINISIMRAFVMTRLMALGLAELNERVARIEQEMGLKFDDVYEVLGLLLGGNAGRTVVEGFKVRKPKEVASAHLIPAES